MVIFSNFLDWMGELVLKFLVGLPNADLGLSDGVQSIATFFGYIAYFLPIHSMRLVWNAWVIAVEALIFALIFVKWFNPIRLGGK